VAGAALLYSDGTYYKTTYVEGATQYQVVAPPAGVSLPAGTSLPADRATITIAGVTYYLYGNTFYKRVVTSGQETFVVVTKPAGVVAVKALPDDFEPMQAGSMVYFRSKDRTTSPTSTRAARSCTWWSTRRRAPCRPSRASPRASRKPRRRLPPRPRPLSPRPSR
jgi:hypothetical protein